MMAVKRLLAGVHAQVVEKVVVLAEELATPNFVALHYFLLSLGPGVYVLKDAEFPRVRRDDALCAEHSVDRLLVLKQPVQMRVAEVSALLEQNFDDFRRDCGP